MKARGIALLVTAAAIGVGSTILITDVGADGRHAAAQAQPTRNAQAAMRRAHYPQVGRRVQQLPKNHRVIVVNRNDYRYYNGVFYQPSARGSFLVVRAPIGARVRSLPAGYVSFFIGPRHYSYVNFTYFLWEPRTREYVVVSEPEGAQAAVVTASETVSGEIFVYPNQGQSDEQRDRDRYECYLWGMEQTGHDPGAAESDRESASDYRRAISACLEGRGYTVK